MKASVVMYGVVGLLFAVAPGTAHALPDALLRSLPFFADWTALPAAEAHNWTALAISMMATITACSALAARDPVRNRDFAIPVMVSKGVSSAAGLILLAVHARYAFYVAIFCADFPLLVVTWLLWRRVPGAQTDE